MTTADKTYFAYGMRIRSFCPLNDLREVHDKADATIRLGKVSESLVMNTISGDWSLQRDGARFKASSRAMYLEWDGVGKVLVCDGREIIVEPQDNATLTELSPFLTGPVLAVLLHQRGNFVLHASSVVINGAAVAFVGAKGYGKSTLAACLKARGHRVISDDIVPLYVEDAKVWTLAGFPRIKLFDDSITAIGADPLNFPTIHPLSTKRSLLLESALETEPIQLCSIYVLNERNDFRITDLSRVQAFIELIKNAHLNRFLEATKAQECYFAFCKDITNLIPIFRLDRPASLDRLSSIANGLEEHLTRPE